VQPKILYRTKLDKSVKAARRRDATSSGLCGKCELFFAETILDAQTGSHVVRAAACGFGDALRVALASNFSTRLLNTSDFE
jgi:hypothetical protein